MVKWFGNAKTKEARREMKTHKIGFGPNRVVFEIRRAKRDKFGEVLRDAEGNILYKSKVERHENHNLTNTTCLTYAKDRLFNSATTETIADYIALSCSTTAPSAAHTVLPAEITTGGLARALATYSVSGCATGECILSNEFTATATHTDVQLMGLLDAASAGSLCFEATITPCTLISGDKVTAKWDKITLS